MLSPLHLALYANAAASGLPHVRTAQGWVVGSRAADGVERFAGIPFAEQPVGKLRFARASLSEVPFPGGVHDGRLPGPPCIQNPAGPIRAPGSEEPPQSEACLHLTLWRPAASQEPAAPLPVMVYIFGGGLCGGSANVVSLNASRLVVRQQVIVVSVSYRLGALGFCPLPDFPGGGSGGMNGIYDIIVALRWLKANVAAFGGDPGNVMLFGQSSGSYAICTLCVAPAAAGLFSKAALQSGPCLGGPPGRGWGPVTSVSPSAIAREVMAQLNVTSGIEGLRAVRDASLIQWPRRYMEDLDVAPYFSAYFPDNAVLRSPPADLWAAGAIHPRAMLVGGTSKDGTAAFYGTAPTLGNIAPDPAQLGEAAYETALKGAWGAAARAVRAHYPLSRFGGSAQAAFVQADADAYVLCPQIEAARMAVAAGVAVWHYEFSHFMPSPTAPGGGCDSGVELDVVEAGASATWATHGAEVRYVFGSEQNHDTLSGRPRIADCPFSPAERRLSDEIGAYWAGLAREGDPNSGGGAGGGRAWWPAYGAGANWTSLVLGVGGGVARAQLHGSACDFWTQQRIGEGGGESETRERVCF